MAGQLPSAFAYVLLSDVFGVIFVLISMRGGFLDLTELSRDRDVKAKDKVLAVPKKLWISQEAVEKSKIGPLVADQPPWVQIALFVIAEK